MSEATTPTGRLFRSLRAEGSAATDAVPALSLDEVVGLRSVSLGSSPATEPVAPPPTDSGTRPDLPILAPAPARAEDSAPPAANPAPPVAPWPVNAPEPPIEVLGPPILEAAPTANPQPEPLPDSAELETTQQRRSGAHAQRGIGAGSVWLIVIGITFVMAFADALVMGQDGLGWLTGVAMLVASVYAAVTVRLGDALIAVVAPPLAFFLATLTAGQLTVSTSGDLLINEAFMIVTTLGSNALWIFGATIAALVIVLVRRGLSRRRP